MVDLTQTNLKVALTLGSRRTLMPVGYESAVCNYSRYQGTSKCHSNHCKMCKVSRQKESVNLRPPAPTIMRIHLPVSDCHYKDETVIFFDWDDTLCPS